MSSFIEILKSIDTDVLKFINGHNCPILDQVMMIISGRFTWIPLYLLFAILIFRDYRSASWLILIFGVLAVVMSDQASNLIKDHVMRLRPSHDPAVMGSLHYYKDDNRDAYMGGLYGFVSNHAANATSLALYLILLFRNKWVTIGLIFWVFLLCYSRVYLGVHYPSDILGGIFVGLITGSLAHKICVLIQRGTSVEEE
jgi:undecaprenyl-diphosphatase